MTELNAVSREDARRITRVVELQEKLPGAHLTAMAGNMLVEMGSLAEVEVFLTPINAEEVAAAGVHGEIHHLDPRMLAAWVRDTIGDAELADRLGEIADSPEAYGLLVPGMKALLVERLAQCQTVLSDD